jgi:hypothetical protein
MPHPTRSHAVQPIDANLLSNLVEENSQHDIAIMTILPVTLDIYGGGKDNVRSTMDI